MQKKEIIQVFFLRWIGNFLVLSAVAAVVLTFAPAIREEIIYRYNRANGVSYVVAGDAYTLEATTAAVNLFVVPEKVLEITPASTEFSIVIPKINANAKVVENVNAASEQEYKAALQTGVAHARGTVYPGEKGNTYLFAHSVGNFWEVNRFNAVFYLLKELEPGDEVNLFYQDKRYIYVVYDKKIVEATDTQYLYTVSSYPMVTLQTCWPPGTTLKRLLVFGRLKTS